MSSRLYVCSNCGKYSESASELTSHLKKHRSPKKIRRIPAIGSLSDLDSKRMIRIPSSLFPATYTIMQELRSKVKQHPDQAKWIGEAVRLHLKLTACLVRMYPYAVPEVKLLGGNLPEQFHMVLARRAIELTQNTVSLCEAFKPRGRKRLK